MSKILKKLAASGRLALVLIVFSGAANAQVVGKVIEYKDGDTELKGYLSYDQSLKGKLPAVLIVHEWWGHNQYARDRADQLAAKGYVAFALDMYGKGKLADHPDQAKAFSSQFNDNEALITSRFNAAYGILKNHNRVNFRKIGAMGYCFGGKIVLEMARQGKELVAVASFHGALATKSPAEKGKIKAAVFVAHGAMDKFVPKADLDALKKEMKAAGIRNSINVYKNAMHSFTNPDADKVAAKFKMPLKYNEHADKDSFKKWLNFLDKAVRLVTN